MEKKKSVDFLEEAVVEYKKLITCFVLFKKYIERLL